LQFGFVRRLVIENFRKFSQVETFQKLYLQCSRIVFNLLIFYRNIYVSGNFPEIFITTAVTDQLEKANRLSTVRQTDIRWQHDSACQCGKGVNACKWETPNFGHP
jgi:hypothetical protein